jgi:hypothetical protein
MLTERWCETCRYWTRQPLHVCLPPIIARLKAELLPLSPAPPDAGVGM